MYNDTHLNILVSYAYLYTQPTLIDFLKRETRNGTINLMLDSGAFTKHNSKAVMNHINVEEYCDFLQDFAPYCDKYVMLDVIGHAEQSQKNYETMIKKGLNPMYVFTQFDKNWDKFNHAVSINPNVCVAGGATCKSDWVVKRYQDAYIKSSKRAKIHALGYFTFPKMLQLHLKSIDASSWKTAAARFGQSIFFAGKRTYRILWPDVVNRRVKFTDEIKEQLRDIGVSPTLFLRKEAHYGENSVDFFINIVNNVRLQKYCKKYGLDYFLATGDIKDVKKIIFVSKHLNTITYKMFLDEFGNDK